MTTAAAEHSSPVVELRLGSLLLPAEVAALTAANASANPEESIQTALRAYASYAARKAQEELLDVALLEPTAIRYSLDTAWQLFIPQFQRATGPMIAEAYIRAFRAAEAGDIPIQLIYSLADEHAVRLGAYFNQTSNDALIQGFNTYVNRQVPPKVALQRALQAYGLNPRQMNGFTSAQQLQPQKVESAQARNLTSKIKAYVGKSLSDRLKLFGSQERHNLDMQAQQVAWSWMVEKKKIPANAKKMWLTAKDEKVCKICGPMHGKKVLVTEKFKMPNEGQLFVPGAHVNCRCIVRLQINPFRVVKRFEPIKKADDDFNPREHPRDKGGRFVRAPRAAEPRAAETRPPAEPREVPPELAGLEEAAAEQAAEDDADVRYQLARAKLAGMQPERKGLADVAPPQRQGLSQRLGATQGLQPRRGLADVVQRSLADSAVESKLTARSLTPRSFGERVVERLEAKPVRGLLPIYAMKPAELPEIMRPKARMTTFINETALPDFYLTVVDYDNLLIGFDDDVRPPHYGTVRIPASEGRVWFANQRGLGLAHVMEEAAQERFDDAIYQIMLNRKNELTRTDPRNPGSQGSNLHHTVPEADVEKALDDLANRDNRNHHPHGTYIIDWVGADGRTEISNEVTYEQLATEYLGVHSTDLELNLVRTRKAHKGRVYDGPRSSVVDTKELPGDYNMTTNGKALTASDIDLLGLEPKIPVRIYDVEPLAAVSVMYEDLDTGDSEIIYMDDFDEEI